MPISEESAELRHGPETQPSELHLETDLPCGLQGNSSLSFRSFISEVGIIAAVRTYSTVSFVIKYLLSIHMHDTKLELYRLHQIDIVSGFRELS